MNKKKQFGVSADLKRSLSEAVSIAENSQNTFRASIIPISRVELDPDNPRQLHLTMDDVIQGIKKSDPQHAIKQEEWLKLKDLANTIENNGIVNPIVVYRRGDVYRVVAGERRTLATILAGKKEIEARIYNEKPSDFTLKIVQWIENNAREDLTLNERVNNIEDIVKLYRLEHGTDKVPLAKMAELTGLSDSQISSYFALLAAPEDIKKLVQTARITNLDKAVFLSKIKDQQSRHEATIEVLAGGSLKNVRHKVKAQTVKRPLKLTASNAGRTAMQINFGVTKNTKVARYVIDHLVSSNVLSKYRDSIFDIDWTDFKSINVTIKKLIKALEFEIAE